MKNDQEMRLMLCLERVMSCLFCSWFCRKSSICQAYIRTQYVDILTNNRCRLEDRALGLLERHRLELLLCLNSFQQFFAALRSGEPVRVNTWRRLIYVNLSKKQRMSSVKLFNCPTIDETRQHVLQMQIRKISNRAVTKLCIFSTRPVTPV